jgi:hypothetical protein
MPMRGELPTITAPTHTRASSVRTGWLRFVAVVSDPGLQTIVALSMIGILVTLNAIFLFPDFGQVYADFSLSP